MRSTYLPLLSALVLALSVGACSSNTVEPNTDSGLAADSGGADGGSSDAGRDTGAGPVDTGVGNIDAATDTDSGTAGNDAATDVDAFVGNDAAVLVDAAVPVDAGNRSPTCTITAPLAGTVRNYDATFTFVATASDPEDGPLSGASVVWRSDLVVAPLGSGLSVTTTLIPGMHTIRCTATDSVGNTGSGTLMVTSRSPVATINHPGNGEVRVAGSSIPFVGLGRDFEDGTLSGASLVWTSSIDGALGTGTMFNAPLSAGTNVVTLTVTDSSGNTGTASITLTITP